MATFTSAGGTGEYCVTTDGIHPQLGHAYRYKDQNCEFWFYVQFDPGSDGRFELSVWYASARRFEGGHPDISASLISVVEENIRRYFEAFDPYGREWGPHPAVPVKFGWRLRR